MTARIVRVCIASFVNRNCRRGRRGRPPTCNLLGTFSEYTDEPRKGGCREPADDRHHDSTLSDVCSLGLCVVSVLGWASMGRIARAFTNAGNPWVGGDVSAPSEHALVVVELFTSEGCSSCPPADEVS